MIIDILNEKDPKENPSIDKKDPKISCLIKMIINTKKLKNNFINKITNEKKDSTSVVKSRKLEESVRDFLKVLEDIEEKETIKVEQFVNDFIENIYKQEKHKIEEILENLNNELNIDVIRGHTKEFINKIIYIFKIIVDHVCHVQTTLYICTFKLCNTTAICQYKSCDLYIGKSRDFTLFLKSMMMMIFVNRKILALILLTPIYIII